MSRKLGRLEESVNTPSTNYIAGHGIEIGVKLAQAAVKDGVKSWSVWFAVVHTVMGEEDFQLWFSDVGGIDGIKRLWAEHGIPEPVAEIRPHCDLDDTGVSETIPSMTGHNTKQQEPTGPSSGSVDGHKVGEGSHWTVSSGVDRTAPPLKSGGEPQETEGEITKSLGWVQEPSEQGGTPSVACVSKASQEVPELLLARDGMPAYSLDRMAEMMHFVRQGRLDEAEALAFAGLRESPACPSFWDVLADIEEARGEKDASARLREVGIQALRYLSEEAGNSPALDALEGWSLWRAERFDEAILALRRLEPFVEGDTAAFFQLLIGSSCVMTKRLREGRIALERAFSGSSNKIVVQEASKGLSILSNMRRGIAQVLEVVGISFEDMLKLEDMQGEDGAEAREIWEVGDLSKPLP